MMKVKEGEKLHMVHKDEGVKNVITLTQNEEGLEDSLKTQ
jgi:hypothetical protein